MDERVELVAARLDRLSSEIIGAAIEVHKALGPGLLESIYETCLCKELATRSIACVRQVMLPVQYKGMLLDQALRLDLLVEGSVVIEIKVVERILPVHEAQLLSYLKLADKRLGLLLNFHVPILKDGIRRIVNNL